MMKKIVSAAITPFTMGNEIDLCSAERMYEFNIGHGIDGFFLFGTMGEWALTTADEKDRIAEHACEVIGERAEVFLGIQDIGLPQMLSNMERRAGLDHDAWVVLFPSKWAGPNCPVKYTHKIADAADRPVFLYHSPGFNGVDLEADQFKDILAHEKIRGVKNSADSIRIRKELLLLKQEADFELYEGQEWGVDESLMLGCDGAIAGFGSCGSKILKNIARMVEKKDYGKAGSLQEKLIGIFKGVYGDCRQHVWSGQKHALVHLGILDSPFSRVEGQNGIREKEIEAVQKCIDDNRELLV